ncbi:hypothetical protein WICPIJ_005983 [Wickerhamomyces pijperi]|uniref:Uncharacterized protein n=1 Tax=Wickerhamomyces pijperi TaxID=599730 RepID=A0A9P8Q324_WICPI|nr:hypothetical protein WICPIJ_005983 [Wickerhamomyces pijperi]
MVPSLRGGEARMMLEQPATLAGTPNMMAVDGNTAVPPGTFNKAASPSDLTASMIGLTNFIMSEVFWTGLSKAALISASEAVEASITCILILSGSAAAAAAAAGSSVFCFFSAGLESSVLMNFGLASPFLLVIFKPFKSKFLSMSAKETPFLTHLARAKYNKSAHSQAMSSLVSASVSSSASSLILACKRASSVNNLLV